jgi:hypothetical protein
MMTTAEMLYFSAEIQKIAGMQMPPPQGTKPKKKNIITRNIGLGTLAAGGLTAALALKNPASAAKYLGQAKQMVTNPKVALQRGWRSGSSNVTKGPGASEATSKRVSLYKDVLNSAVGGQRQSIKSLDTLAAGGSSARTSGWGSAGRSFSRGGQKLNMSDDLAKRVGAAQETLKGGGKVDEKVLASLYGEIQGAGKGLKMRKGITHYAPGERSLVAGAGTVGGAAGALETEDADGRKRGIAERLARGTVGAATGAMTAPLIMGRGAGLSKKSLLTGKHTNLLSQKTLMPLAGSTAAMGAGAVATDAAGSGGALVDSAFGQNQ